MKKYILILAFLVSSVLCFNASAQTCNIGNNDSIVIHSVSLDKNANVVNVSLANDSNDTAANVTVTVVVTYSNGTDSKQLEFTGTTYAGTQSSKDLPISIDSCYNGNSKYVPVSATAKAISGSKCKQ